MNLAIIADNKPIKINLRKGENYFFCTCGRSANQPFCDGSHKVTELLPLRYTPEEDGDFAICMCKRSTNFPFCDGSHKQFSDDQVGSTG